MPKVSIIIPVYGVEKYLKECLDSVLCQSLKDIEILLIDDGGKDNCPQMIDEYALKDDRIIAIHKKNGGYGHSCNVGLEKATGEYIAILEPDDFIKADMYEKLYKCASENQLDIVKSTFNEYYDLKGFKYFKNLNWGKEYDIPGGVFKNTDNPIFLSLHPSIWSCLYKKSFIDKHNIRFVEAPGAGWTDNLFQVQTLCLADRISYIDEAFYNWRKLNLYEENDLKDYTIPFKRSDEVHAWLDENSINDENTLSKLYLRELSYIKLVLGALKFKDLKNGLSLINKMIKRMDENILKSKLCKSKYAELMYIYKHPYLSWLKARLKLLRREAISIKLGKGRRQMILFNNFIYTEK